jgi:hypothetical protein
MRVTFSASSSLQYYAYYLSGLRSVLGPFEARFAQQDLPQLGNAREGLCVVLESGVRLFIAADDFSTINEEALDWCDAYGQVNVAPGVRSHRNGHKILPLGPGFGIRWEPRRVAYRYALSAAAVGREFAGFGARLKAFALHERTRAPLDRYMREESDGGYLFFLGTYWSKHPEANGPRQALWSAMCELTGIRVEGGFVGAPATVDDTIRATKRYTLDEYVAKTQRSVVALNTPAVHGCLGWKLGEYMALGKAIVSLPIASELPGEFVPGRHYLESNDEREAVEQVMRLSADRPLRSQLETSARQYFEEYVSPQAAVHRLIRHADP